MFLFLKCVFIRFSYQNDVKSKTRTPHDEMFERITGIKSVNPAE